ncbi:hypothetical protein IV203_027925 [Nitzschia inconspicua]|uniref:Uncharacterized protein n=1 Tax=Nitzschia inconspicua TaxID=303405 RepID=A0A9K3LXX9_9STRA|nr:hypothetical protein IV203_027925 [Nitzschia inconspicua]
MSTSVSDDNTTTTSVIRTRTVDVDDEPIATNDRDDVVSDTVDPIIQDDEPTKNNSNSMMLQFDDFIDLQTRLVLLPYIEEEGKGAVILSLQVSQHQQQLDMEGMVLKGIEETDTENCDFVQMDFTEILATVRNAPTPIRLVFEKVEKDNDAIAEEQQQSQKKNIKESPAAQIINGNPVEPSHYEEKKDDGEHTKLNQLHHASHSTATATATNSSSSSSTRQRQPINTALDDDHSRQNTNKNNSISNSMFALSAWGLRMKAQSEKLAADAMATMNAVNHSAIASSKRQTVSLQLDDSTGPVLPEDQSLCQMYLQTNVGAYFCISGPNSAPNDGKKSIPVTTSSLLCIRKSATEPLISPTEPSSSSTKYSFQWYRSTSNKTRYQVPHSASSLYQQSNDAASVASKSTQHSGESNTSVETSYDTTNTEWIQLEGATHATFQPNTTLMGRTLRCIVTIRQITVTPASSKEEPANDTNETTERQLPTVSLMDHDNDDDDDDASKDDSDNNDEDVEQVICDLREPVRADMVLFNGARQAMVRGAKFGNMLERTDQKDKRSFRVEVGMARKTNLKTQRTITVNSVHVYKLCSKTNEYVPLTDQPLLQVSAQVPSNNAKYIDLIFSTFPPTSEQHPDDDESAYTTGQFLKEFCVLDNRIGSSMKFQLEAPNRLTRESLLLALGIANYQGKPALLDDKTVLYRDDVPVPPANVVETSSQSEMNPPSPTGLTVTNVPPEQTTTVAGTKEKDDDDDSLSTSSGSDAEAICSNLPTSPPRNPTSGVSQPSPSGFFSCQSSVPEGGTSLLPPSNSLSSPHVPAVDTARIRDFQRELEFLRSELARKDRNITDLQRQVQRSDAAHLKTKQDLQSSEQELKQALQDCERIQISKRQVEHSLQAQHEAMQKAEAKHKQRVAKLEEKIQQGANTIADLEKANRTLQNEKAVLGAAVEARESKLVRMEELQTINERLSQEMAQHHTLQAKLDKAEERCIALQRDLKVQTDAEAASRKELEEALRKVDSLTKRIEGEKAVALSHQSQLDVLVKKNQQLKGERNSYKQKNDSLSKEISRLCRNGRTIRDIERIVADHEALVQEAEVLRVQKRKALEEAHKYRTSYEQIKSSEQVLCVEEDTLRAVERSAELERLLTEMTDYVHAKEMQLETMKQVNEALQDEIRNLAKANLQKNEV